MMAGKVADQNIKKKCDLKAQELSAVYEKHLSNAAKMIWSFVLEIFRWTMIQSSVNHLTLTAIN